MIWARRLMFSTTDLIFPGFVNATTGKTNEKQFRGVRVRSSWILQALLYADALFFCMWVISFLWTFDISMSVLKELHGNLVICMTALFIIVNVPRLLFGFRGNERDKLELLALFWMTTLIVQGPLLGFILFTDIFTPILRAFTTAMDSVMMAIILLEFIFGTLHLKNLIKDELRIIKLAKLTEQSASSPPRRTTTGDDERFNFPVPLGPPQEQQQPAASSSAASRSEISENLPPGYDDNYLTDTDDEEDVIDAGNWSSDDDDDDDDDDENDNTRRRGSQQQSQSQKQAYLRRKYFRQDEEDDDDDSKLNYRLNIRRLTPEPEPSGEFTADEEEEEEENARNNEDGSNVVTSTSDVARQRSSTTTATTATRVS